MRACLAWFGFVAVCFLAALTGIVAPPGAWYAALVKPPWTPPNWLFGPVWTTLYLLMGTAAWLVWRRGRAAGRGSRGPLAWFLVQLALNAAWTPIFFGAHSLLGGLVCIAVLWCAILATLLAFFRRVALAGALLVPYLAWVTLAAALNLELWRLNR